MTNRLTEKSDNFFEYKKAKPSPYIYDEELVRKLGKIEDLMEKYKIEDIEMLERMIIRHDNNCKLEEQIGCPLDVLVKAFQKYIGWTTDCDFGYDNIPDEFEKYQNDKKFMNLKYNEGLMYIAIQETLEDIELEKTLKNKGK